MEQVQRIMAFVDSIGLMMVVDAEKETPIASACASVRPGTVPQRLNLQWWLMVDG